MLVSALKGGSVGGASSATQKYSPTADEGNIASTAYSVTSGKYYVICGLTRKTYVNSYSISGGNIISSAFKSQGAGSFSSTDVVSVVMVVKATSSSITLSVSGSSSGLYGGQIIELS